MSGLFDSRSHNQTGLVVAVARHLNECQHCLAGCSSKHYLRTIKFIY